MFSPYSERLDALLAQVGLQLASRNTSDAFWLDIGGGYWLWVRATRMTSFQQETFHGGQAVNCNPIR